MTLHRFLTALTLQLAMLQPMLATPAFPEAEGAGANALGGRGGDVYYVTTLLDNNSNGSLRYGISTAPASGRTILFKVSGNIVLNSTLTINKPRITVAGQTAPGDGICFQNYSFNISADDVIVRHLRTRLGTNALQEADCMWINSGSNIIVDHVSASWSVDEVLSSSRDVSNLTVQNCFITEALNNSIHEKGSHGYGGILSSDNFTTYSYLRNLYAHNRSRNPRIGSSQDPANPNTLRLDFRNNVIYNYGDRAGYTAEPEACEVNYVGNYNIKGPSSSYNYILACAGTNTHVYQEGNFNDINRNGLLDGSDTGWGMFSGTYTSYGTAFPVPAATSESAPTAYERVVALSGAMPWRRDSADQRIARTVREQNGMIIDAVAQVGTWPTLLSEPAPADMDIDGIPDDWEAAMGWNPGVANNNHLNADGYTDLEWYLNWLAAPHGECDYNNQVDLNLRELTGGLTHLTFAVANGTNGTVSLLGDGYTARFTAAANFNGLANFTYSANDPVNSAGFGPVTVGVLVNTNGMTVVERPTVSFSNPIDGAELGAGVEITLSADVAQGDGAVTNVQFYAGTTDPLALVGENETAPYSQIWTTPQISGIYTLRVIAMDDNGLNGSETITVTVNGNVHKVSTADGMGSDIEMQERSDGGSVNFSQSAVNGTALHTRTASGGDRNEVTGLRFDLSAYMLSELTNVTFNMVAWRTDTSTRYVNFYGVTQGTAGGTGTFTTETWTGTALDASNLYGDLPGLLATDNDPSTQNINLGSVTYLGQMVIPASTPEGDTVRFDDPALTSFIQTYGAGGNQVTLVLAAGNNSGGQWNFAASEASETSTAAVSGSAGDFAPYLEFEVLTSVEPPMLDYQIAGDGSGIEFNWVGNFKLQYQTNSLQLGMGNNWVDYPETNSPVAVPIEMSTPSAWFRLAPLQ